MNKFIVTVGAILGMSTQSILAAPSDLGTIEYRLISDSPSLAAIEITGNAAVKLNKLLGGKSGVSGQVIGTGVACVTRASKTVCRSLIDANGTFEADREQVMTPQ